MSDKKLVSLTLRMSPGLHRALKDRCDGKGNSLNATVCGLLERALLMDDLSRVARETIRQEMRAEFEARRWPNMSANATWSMDSFGSQIGRNAINQTLKAD